MSDKALNGASERVFWTEQEWRDLAQAYFRAMRATPFATPAQLMGEAIDTLPEDRRRRVQTSMFSSKFERLVRLEMDRGNEVAALRKELAEARNFRLSREALMSSPLPELIGVTAERISGLLIPNPVSSDA
jgi:hypothetical protein